MEEKKRRELADEQLDTVSGGKKVDFHKVTLTYDDKKECRIGFMLNN